MRACRVDANHKEIVEYFRGRCWSVLDIHTIKNCCDIIVSRHGVTVAIEIKDGTKPPSARKLTKGEVLFKDTWQGQYYIITSIEDVDNMIKEVL